MLIEAEGEGRRTGRVAGERKRLFVILQKAFARLQCGEPRSQRSARQMGGIHCCLYWLYAIVGNTCL